MSIQIKEAQNHQAILDFITFNHSLYKGCPYWVPRIINDEVDLLSRPFSFIDRKLFLAYKGERIVGRIAVVVNHNEVRHIGQNHARFGWIDFMDDPSISKALITAAAKWAREKGMDRLKGPYGYTNLDPSGMLTFGFDELATAINIYNYAYYPDHMDKLGFDTDVKWVEYEGKVPDQIPERVQRLSALVRERYALREAKLESAKDLNIYASQFFQLFNESYSHLSAFVPISEEQKQLYIDKFFKLIHPDYISIILNEENEIVAFGITLPSFSRALQKADGSLQPFGWYHLQRAMRKNDRADLYLIGVKPEYQSKGVPGLVMKKIFETFIKNGIKYAETNPEQEANFNIQNLWKDYEVRLHKRRQTYIKEL